MERQNCGTDSKKEVMSVKLVNLSRRFAITVTFLP
jgi:hypothetical protein